MAARRRQSLAGLAVVALLAGLYGLRSEPALHCDVEEAFLARQSDRWVGVEGTVQKTLADDRDGSRHQRFILELDCGTTVLVAHNIDLADRVPLSRGDRIRLRGEYEWNDRGGVVHWTHHDPEGRHRGGWIELEGRRFL